MAKIGEILDRLEMVAPRRFAFEFDKVGLQVGEEGAAVKRAVVALDRSLGAIRFAIENNCQLLLAHHPLIFNPLDEVTSRSHTSKSVLQLARHDVAFIAAHTNWDSARGGINDVLARLLGMQETLDFGSGASVTAKKLVFFCPAETADLILDALWEKGAGSICSYRKCSFLSEGVASYEGREGSAPSVGEPLKFTRADELRIEIYLPPGTERAVERALLKIHPYETPAYDMYSLAPAIEQSAGRIGELQERITFSEFLKNLDAALDTVSYGWGDPNKPIRKVAIVGGAADGEWMHAQRAGADVLVTGEVKQHIAVEASESGLCIVAAGHYATENPGALELSSRMSSLVSDVEWLTFVPTAGLHGRPFIHR